MQVFIPPGIYIFVWLYGVRLKFNFFLIDGTIFSVPFFKLSILSLSCIKLPCTCFGLLSGAFYWIHSLILSIPAVMAECFIYHHADRMSLSLPRSSLELSWPFLPSLLIHYFRISLSDSTNYPVGILTGMSLNVQINLQIIAIFLILSLPV